MKTNTEISSLNKIHKKVINKYIKKRKRQKRFDLKVYSILIMIGLTLSFSFYNNHKVILCGLFISICGIILLIESQCSSNYPDDNPFIEMP